MNRITYSGRSLLTVSKILLIKWRQTSLIDPLQLFSVFIEVIQIRATNFFYYLKNSRSICDLASYEPKRNGHRPMKNDIIRNKVVIAVNENSLTSTCLSVSAVINVPITSGKYTKTTTTINIVIFCLKNFDKNTLTC